MTTQHQISSMHPPTTSTGPATNIPTKARCSEFTRQNNVVFWCTSLRLTNPQLPFCPAVFISPITLVDPHVVSCHSWCCSYRLQLHYYCYYCHLFGSSILTSFIQLEGYSESISPRLGSMNYRITKQVRFQMKKSNRVVALSMQFNYVTDSFYASQ